VKTWNVILATLVIFTAGIFTGALLVIISERAHAHPHRAQAALVAGRTEPSTNAVREPARLALPFGISAKRGTPKDFLDRLDSELKLTPEQHAQIKKILDDGQQHAAQIWQTIAPQIREEMKSAREQIRELLTPEQRARFEELMKFRPPKGPETPLSGGLSTNPPAGPATNPPAETPAK
jgi:Spy/CpxP family protein refolding chaperone